MTKARELADLLTTAGGIDTTELADDAVTAAKLDDSASFTVSGLNVEIPDNNSGPVTIQQGGNSYFKIVTTNTSESVQLGNSTTNPDVLLGNGNVGISNTAPDFNLSVGNSSSVNPSIQIMSATNSNAQLLFGDGAGAAGYRGTVVYGNSTDSMSFSTAGTERLRIQSDGSVQFKPDGTTVDMTLDASGNLLVGTTSTLSMGSSTTAGFQVGGDLRGVRTDGNPIMYLKHQSNDGRFINFYKDTSSVGSIGTNSGIPYFLRTSGGIAIGNSALLSAGSSGAINDATSDLGGSSNRWKDLYLSGTAFLSGQSSISGNTASAGSLGITSGHTSSPIRFYTGEYGNTAVERMSIGSSGDVRVLNDLAVDGDLRIKGTEPDDAGRLLISVTDTQVSFQGNESSLQTDKQFIFAGGNQGIDRIATLRNGGINFGSDTADANLLNDYEEGSFTYTIKYDDGSGSSDYTGQHTHTTTSTAYYVKIGRFVSVSYPGVSVPDDNVALYNYSLPFTAAYTGAGGVGEARGSRFRYGGTELTDTIMGPYYHHGSSTSTVSFGYSSTAGDFSGFVFYLTAGGSSFPQVTVNYQTS